MEKRIDVSLKTLQAGLFSLFCLSSQIVFADSFTWSGGALDDDWSAASNWEGGVAPADDGEGDLIFPSGPTVLTADNNLEPFGFTVDSITIGDTYEISGNTFIFGNGSVSNLITVAGSPGISPSISNDEIILVANISIDVATNNKLLLISNITGTTGLSITGPGIVVLLGDNDYEGGTQVNAGQLYVDGSITGLSPSVVVNPGGLLGGMGIVGNVTNHGVVSPGDIGVIGTLTLTGHYLQGADGTLNIRVDAVGNTDLLDIAGVAMLDGTLNVTALPGTYVLGTSYTILSSGGGFNTKFATLNLPPFLAISYDPNQFVILTVIPVPPVPSLAGRHVNHHNPQQVYKYLLEIDQNPDPGLTTIIDNLIPLSNEALTRALDQMHPAIFGAFDLLNTNTSSMIASFLTRHMADICCQHCDADCCIGNAHVWFQPFGYFYDQDRIGEQVGFEANTEGVITGFNYSFNNGISIGAGAGYSNGYIHWKHHRGKGTVNSGYFGIGADYACEPLYLEASLVGGINSYHAKRNIKFNTIDRHAKHTRNGYDWTAHIGGGGDIRIGAFYLKPYSNVDYLYLYQKRFTEHGAGTLNLSVNGRRANMLRSEVGLSITRSFYSGPGRCWMPTIFISGINECYLRKRHYKSRFEGEELSFEVRTFNKPIYLVSPGFDFTFMIDDDASLSLRYSAELNSQIATQKGDVRFEWFF